MACFQISDKAFLAVLQSSPFTTQRVLYNLDRQYKSCVLFVSNLHNLEVENSLFQKKKNQYFLKLDPFSLNQF